MAPSVLEFLSPFLLIFILDLDYLDVIYLLWERKCLNGVAGQVLLPRVYLYLY